MSILKSKTKNLLTRDCLEVELIDREEQVKDFNKIILNPLLNEEQLPIPCYIYGPKGSGKTFVVRKLIETNLSEIKKHFPNFYYFYFNSREQKITSLYYLILNILSGLSIYFPFYSEKLKTNVGLPKRGIPLNECLLIFEELIEKFKLSILLVIDEVDRIIQNEKKDSVFSYFLDLKRNFIGCSTIFISNDPFLLEKIRQDTRNRIPSTIHFRPYTTNDFYHILKYYANLTLKEGSWKEEDLKEIAKAVSEFSTSIRDLKLTLYYLGEFSENELDLSKLTTAIDKSQADIFKEEILSRPPHQKMILFAIALIHKRINQIELRGLKKYTEIPSLAKVYSIYKALGKKLGSIYEPKSFRTFWNMINSLQNDQLITIKIQGRGRGRGVVSLVYPKNASWEYFYDVLKGEFGE